MAIQTLLHCQVGDETGTTRIEFDIEDTSDPADWSLVAGRVVNEMARSCYVLIQRGNSTNWLEGEIAAGQTVGANAGGPVRNMSDLPRIMLVTR